jgi:hypothetical protein
MPILGIVALCAALGGCAASREEVSARLGEHYIGKNADALVIDFGPPASTLSAVTAPIVPADRQTGSR